MDMRTSRLLSSVLRLSIAASLLLAATFMLARPSIFPAKSALAAGEKCGALLDFSPDIFESPTQIANSYFPLTPGKQFIYGGSADRGGGVSVHRVKFTVTDLGKEIDGITTLVVIEEDANRNEDAEDFELNEKELAFFAGDDDGNVWAMGEYPEEYEDGEFVGAPSTWISGQHSSKAGVHMPADPVVGMDSYHQGKSPAIKFYDCAQPIEIIDEVCLASKCFEDVLKTQEWDPAEPDVSQLKYYAPGVGLIRIDPVNDPEGETLVLEKASKLNKRAMDRARQEALELDQNGYEYGKGYNATDPAEPLNH